jgi:hypothetical protein
VCTRVKLIGASVLLCLALAATVFSAILTLQAVQRFEARRQLVASGDVTLCVG